MHTIDVIVGCLVVLVGVLLVAIIARQRYMLRVGGAVPLAVRRGETRWIYGVARYVGGELRWYRSFGFGTRPTRVFHRSRLTVTGHRRPDGRDMDSLPTTAVVVECQDGGVETVMALGDGAYTGFVSWIEASAPTG